jgi:hypothetical protein
MSCLVLTDQNDFDVTVNPATGKRTFMIVRDRVLCGSFKLYLRFQFFEGEWYLDTREGVPYFRLIFVKNPDFSVVRNVLRRVILSIPTVATVKDITFDYAPGTRELQYTFEARATDGRKIQGGSGKPFIIDGKDLSDLARNEAIT